MSTVSRRLPAHPHLDVPKQQARELLRQVKNNLPEALDRIHRRHPRDPEAAAIKLSDAQLVIAREYGFSSWSQLKQRIDGNTVAGMIDKAIRAGDAAGVTEMLKAHPGLLHVPVVSGNWGPPMSHAANLGRLDMVKCIAALGAKDFHHALGRALLHGDIDIARWLLEQGTVITPGDLMGCCETLNERGFGFLDDAGIPFSDEKGNSLAPLAMVLESYSRNPSGKHAILKRFRMRGYEWPDTPMMAFHSRDLVSLEAHLQRDPGLLHRRFAYREIYPPELGCADDGRSGLHGTPIGGTTLLHLAIDFDEQEIFDWLLRQGADVNAPALMSPDGFGGHTPLFNALVSCAYSNGRQRDAYMAGRLLDLGADIRLTANLRKFLDWVDTPGWHIAENVTPLAWAVGFPIKNWVNREAIRLVEELR